MTDDKEAGEHPQHDRRYRIEIHRRDHRTVIAQEGPALPAETGAPGGAFHPARDRPLGNLETQHPQFAMDARCTPSRIVGHPAEDQLPDLF